MTNRIHPAHCERLDLARAFLDTHYDTPITIERISQEIAFSPYYFIRLFYRRYGQTPHQYLIQRRISKAKELLQSSDLSVTEICAAVGFESLGSFSALFRRESGLSPSIYREKMAEQPQNRFIPLCVCILHGINESESLTN